MSYAIARYALGHQFPFFAPVSAWIALGFSQTRQLRRVAELAVGVAVGVGLGDLIVHGIGSGWWQIALVLVLAASVARFLDRGGMFTTQAGVQAIVVVGLPASVASGGALGRWTDALVGGAVAVGVAALTPGDPRRLPRRAARQALLDLAATLGGLVAGLRHADADDVEDALVRGPLRPSRRSTSGATSPAARATWHACRRAGCGTATSSPRSRTASAMGDRALRNARVVARRSIPLCSGRPRPHRAGGRRRGARVGDRAARRGARRRGIRLERPQATLADLARADGPVPARRPGTGRCRASCCSCGRWSSTCSRSPGTDPAEARALLPEI